jgi:hypothetical protein
MNSMIWGDARWIVIRGQLRGHNDTPFGRPTPAGLSAAREVGRPLGVFGGLGYYRLLIFFCIIVPLIMEFTSDKSWRKKGAFHSACRALPLYALKVGTPETASWLYRGWPPTRWAACSRLTTPWLPHAIRPCKSGRQSWGGPVVGDATVLREE